MRLKKQLKSNLIGLCALALFGCGSLENAIAKDITPAEKVSQYDFTKMLEPEQEAQWRTELADAIKKDSRGLQFTPASATGWETTLIEKTPDRRSAFSISEAERTKVIGVMTQNNSYPRDTRKYVLLPDYVYVCVNNYLDLKVAKIPYSMMYHRDGELKETHNALLNLTKQQPLYAEDLAKTKDMCASFCEQEELKTDESSLLEMVFANTYKLNTAVIIDILNSEIQKTKWAEDQQALKKSAEEFKQAEKDRKAKEIAEWNDAPAIARADGMKGKTIVFKSLYLGMPLEDAYFLLCKWLSVDPEGVDMESGANGSFKMPSDQIQKAVAEANRAMLEARYGDGKEYHGADIRLPPALYVEADANGKVTNIRLSAGAVNQLFNAQDMDGSAFADQFIKAYGIPKMDITGTWDNPAWVFTSKDGARLTIDSQKVLLLEKVASQADLKKSFD